MSKGRQEEAGSGEAGSAEARSAEAGSEEAGTTLFPTVIQLLPGNAQIE